MTTALQATYSLYCGAHSQVVGKVFCPDLYEFLELQCILTFILYVSHMNLWPMLK